MTRYASLAMRALPLVVLAACGGGAGGAGGGGGFSNNLSSAPGDAAISAYVQASHQYTLTAKDTANNNYSLQISSVPNAGTAPFEGVAKAYSTADTVSLSKAGVVVASSAATSYFMLMPYDPLGKVDATGTPFEVATSTYPLPAMVNVGDTRPIANITRWHDLNKFILDGYEAVTYTVTARDLTSLLLCVNSTDSLTTAQGMLDGLADGTETDCYAVTAAGTATLVSITITVGGASLKFQ